MKPSGRGKKTGRAGKFRPRAAGAAQALLKDIGLPEKVPFKPDPFQTEAAALIESADVLVSAPTGSGKTWIAETAMARVVAAGRRAWYASPLKALSNAKLLEFSARFGPEKVGILTGDRKENPDAPIIVGTTEILRNQLYDAMTRGEDLDCDLVVLDEAHYLGDFDRGVVWEEVIIYLPVRVRLLLLSATLANAEELADWLHLVRRQPCRVVRAEERPVPLVSLYLAPDGEVRPFLERGRLSPKIQHLLRRPEALTRPVPIDKTLKALEELDLLPAIFFLPSRADCDQALAFAKARPAGRWADSQPDLNRTIDRFLKEFPFLKGHHLLGYLRRFAVASHHAGHLPHFKLLVERLMQLGLLRAIFSTSTVAAGVNFPARSVVLRQSDRFNGVGFVDLTATELMQMTGRAGRRGMDNVGFAVITPGPHQNLPLLADLLTAPPEPIESRIKLDFSMVLNLLRSHTPEEVKPLLDLSLAVFQSAGRAETGRPRFLDRLSRTLEDGRCGDIERAIIARERHAQAAGELERLEGGWDDFVEELKLTTLLTPGRVVLDDRGRPWLVRRTAYRRTRQGVVATRLTSQLKLKRGRLRMKFLGLDRIAQVTATQVEIRPDRDMLAELRRLSRSNFKPAAEPTDLSPAAQAKLDQALDRLEQLRRNVDASPCRACPLNEQCHDRRSQLHGWLNKAETWLAGLAEVRERLWLGFVRRQEFLESEGFAATGGRLTAEGEWAANLRLDHPLVIAEAIRRDALPRNRPPLLAGLMAPFVLDRERAWPKRLKRLGPDNELTAAFRKLEAAVAGLAGRLKEAGFEAPRMIYVPALALFLWAQGGRWDEIVTEFEVEPGDMASLVFRAADNLRQLASLHQTHPDLAAAASKARQMILREPVVALT